MSTNEQGTKTPIPKKGDRIKYVDVDVDVDATPVVVEDVPNDFGLRSAWPGCKMGGSGVLPSRELPRRRRVLMG